MAKRKLKKALRARAKCIGRHLKGRKFKNRADVRKAFKQASRVCRI